MVSQLTPTFVLPHCCKLLLTRKPQGCAKPSDRSHYCCAQNPPVVFRAKAEALTVARWPCTFSPLTASREFHHSSRPSPNQPCWPPGPSLNMPAHLCALSPQAAMLFSAATCLAGFLQVSLKCHFVGVCGAEDGTHGVVHTPAECSTLS